MAKLKKIDYINILILIAVLFAYILIFTRFTYIYGSTTDWQNQHWVFPEYFRNLFYKNHDLTPNLALNIGGGQNIYNFSYYGLFSPMILPSYLFPFVKMMDYIIVTTILSVICSIILFYIWLKRKNYDSKICFFVSFIFVCSSPFIFHSHRHIMFINYIPFLMLGLIGIDAFFAKKKTVLLLISSFLLIMTSYFFSVSSIVVFFLYAIYMYIKTEQKFSFKGMAVKLLRLAVPIVISVISSAILLLPTFFAILNGRKGVDGGKGVRDFSVLIPKIDLQSILYNPYSLGVTAFAIIALIAGFFSKKKENIFLSSMFSMILVFPVFVYILNGTLYLDSKVLIPFLPLICILIADYIVELINNHKFDKRVFIIFFAVSLIGVLCSQRNYKLIFLADAISASIAVFIYCKTAKKIVLYVSLILFPVICCIASNSFDYLLKSSDAKSYFSEETDQMINETLNNDNGFYRFSNELNPLSTVNKIYSDNYYQTTVYSSIYNKPYNRFYFDTFNNEINFRNSVITNSTKNVLFDIFMGNKYLITDTGAPVGYSQIKSNGSTAIFRNDNVLPFGYATDKLMSKKDFNKLGYPYSDEALLKYGIVNTDVSSDFQSDIEPYSPQINSVEIKNLDYKKENGTYFVNAKNDAEMSLKLNEPINNKVLIIRFNMDLKSKTDDTYIFINGVKNKLTCTDWRYRNDNYVFDFVISSNKPIEQLDLRFMKGKYKISDIETYLLDYDKISNIRSGIDTFEADMTKTTGDVISGKINVSNDGYFILNVPYDRGFNIKVDGQNVPLEKVNTAFVGFKIKKGERNIEITYHAPLQKEGSILSISGLFLAIVYILFEKRKRLFGKLHST